MAYSASRFVPKFQSVYQDGVSKGYSVANTKQTSAALVPLLHSEIKTPYIYNGMPVIAVCDTDMRAASGRDMLRNDFGTELYVANELGFRDRNLEDIAGNANIADITLDAKDGSTAGFEDVRREAADFASAASEYPHVFMYDEYVEVRTPINKRLGVDPPNEADYEKYLDATEKKLCDKDVVFVGAITNRSQLNQARASMPGFQVAMDDFAKETEDPQFD